MSQDVKRDYSATLRLPRTSFSMRANLLQMEPRHQERWDGMDLYRLRRERSSGLPPYVFHDGPPYANGPIHMGHLLNKILKDLVVRSRQMEGFSVHFVPGWDCHGLPIEHKVLKDLEGDLRWNADLAREPENRVKRIRERCRDYARHFMELQSVQMRRLGTLADYENPYLTMDPRYEGAVLDVFAALVAEGLVYRDVKPVHWSIANQTALAEAELEYENRTDTSVFVLFELRGPGRLPPSLGLPSGGRPELMIWTTTPWTLPANLAVAVGPELAYGLFRVDGPSGRRLVIVAEELAGRLFSLVDGLRFELLGSCSGRELEESGVSFAHPFVDREGQVVTADYVTLEEGTGLVHTAPGHGVEDYYTGMKHGLPVYCPVLADGTFDATVPEWLRGVDVWAANDRIVEHLRRSGHLFFDHQYSHSYPHDWRSKTPTIFRATEQWFIAVDKPFGAESSSLRRRALESAADRIRFVPDWGRSRLEGMLEARPDWCISRQRSWGLPIPAFFDAEGRVLLTEGSTQAVADAVRRRGSDFWFAATPEELLGGYDPAGDAAAPLWAREAGRGIVEGLRKGEDIFDVWFESGSSWNGVLRDRDIGYPADLYLEGSDQHRGWFQLSLLPALGATGVSPFRAVLTHGFMVAADGRKMSKSQGNAIEVEDVLRTHGADVCRWWVSSLNYTNDIKVDWEFFKVAGDEYRKVRNTIRFLLGNLSDFDPTRHVRQPGAADWNTVDAWILGELAAFMETVREGYREFQFKRVSEAVFDFCNDSLSAVYLAAVKDRLYCDRPDSPRRRRTQTVMHRIARDLIRAIAPILVHTAEEAWLALNSLEMDSSASVHLESLPEPIDFDPDPRWQEGMEFRRRVLKELEVAKTADAGLKNPLDAGVRAAVPEELLRELSPLREELVDLCGVSRLYLEPGESIEVRLLDLREEPRCERSWKRDETVRARPDGSLLSDRDADALEALGVPDPAEGGPTARD
jgi:isoleucyl-tRNA synthetase